MRGLVNLLPVLLIGGVFWALILRPAKARAAAAARTQAALLPGTEILTTSGLYARVVEVEDDVMVLETAPGTRSRWARGAVGTILSAPPGLPAAEDPPS